MHQRYIPLLRALSFCVLFCFLINSASAKDKYKRAKLADYIPSGFMLLDSASGDLNADGYIDYVLVLKSIKEDKIPGEARPLLLLMGAEKGKLELSARNDNVVLCSDCGGTFGDPYKKVTIKDQSFSVEHTVGATWKWTRIITFKFLEDAKGFLLHKDENFSYKQSSSVRQPGSVSNKSDFDALPFTCFAYNKGY